LRVDAHEDILGPLGSNGTVNRLKAQGNGLDNRSFSRTARFATSKLTTQEISVQITGSMNQSSNFFGPGELAELQSHPQMIAVFKGNQLKWVGCSVAPQTPFTNRHARRSLVPC
jgi:hypothetical protein